MYNHIQVARYDVMGYITFSHTDVGVISHAGVIFK